MTTQTWNGLDLHVEQRLLRKAGGTCAKVTPAHCRVLALLMITGAAPAHAVRAAMQSLNKESFKVQMCYLRRKLKDFGFIINGDGDCYQLKEIL
jgi:hypothetical protein